MSSLASRLLPLLGLLAFSVTARATVSLPTLLADHMVIQRDAPVRIWGRAAPGEHVRVTFRQQVVEAETDAQGAWHLFLAPLTAGGPDDLVVAGENILTLREVLVGELWIASGQSNMRWTVQQSNNAEQEIAAAQYPRIRYFQIPQKVSDTPEADVVGQWHAITPQSVAGFSAVGYYFARELTRTLNVPIGVIQATYGNTPAQSWVRREVLAGDPMLAVYFPRWEKTLAAYPAAKERYDRAYADWKAASAVARAKKEASPSQPPPPGGPGHPSTPSGLFNAMIAPLTPLTIRGVIWYQGESSTEAEDAPLYHRLFSALISDWRRQWQQGDFPFLFAQLSIDRSRNLFPEVREAQRATLQLRRTAMIVTTDVGDPIGQHPTDKQSVGHRFALAARAVAYGEDLSYSGPLFQRVTIEHDHLRVWFEHAAAGLRTKDGEPPRTFWIAGVDRVFVPATATIEGSDVIVSSEAVKHPVAARYAWLNDTRPANLTNADGLPASAFRSDDWENAVLPR